MNNRYPFQQSLPLELERGQPMFQGQRCLILGCSQRKKAWDGKHIALERYDGPMYRVLRRALRDIPQIDDELDIFILSAEYGLIQGTDEIEDYERRMTRARAIELRDESLARIQQWGSGKRYVDVLVTMGTDYRPTIEGLELALQCKNILWSTAPSGRKMTELKEWLYAPYGGPPPSRPSRTKDTFAQGYAVIRDRKVSLEPEQIAEIVAEASQVDQKGANRYRYWYALVGDQKVAPKWLVGQITGLKVSDFSADEARRVLRQLGVDIRHT